MVAELWVFDKAFEYQGTVAEYDSLRATRRHLAVSTAEFVAPSDLDTRAALSAPGSWVVVSHKDEQLMCGRASSDSGTILHNDPVSYFVTGAWDVVMRGILGWPVPGAALTGQSVPYWTNGAAPAETVLKNLVTANKARLGLSWLTVAPDQGRGLTINPSLRFHPLGDRVDLHGKGIEVTFELVEGAGIRLDVREVVTHTLPLSAATGEITAGTWERVDPTASRVVAGSQGEAESRVFFGPLVDAAREAEYGFCGEVFIDARDTDDAAEVNRRMADALAEHGPKVSVSLELAETEDFTYPEVFRVGDVVPLDLTEDVSTTDVIDSVEVSGDAGSGFVVTPHVGDLPTDPTTQLVRRVGALAAGQRDARVR